MSPIKTPASIQRIHIIAQSHIDLAWLWRWDPETVHVCCKATFGQATANMDAHPDYTFSQSQVPLYRATEQNHPEIFKKMENYIKEGRWEIAGGLFVEFEGAEPCGESLVRQCVLGKRYFKQRFGIEVTTCWQEDAWTHPWQIPQILVKCGIDAYFFNRGKRDPQLFWWQSPDGSRVLAVKPIHVLRGRSSFFDWLMVKKWIKKNVLLYHLDDVMVRIGKGDHGGGPSPKEIATVHAWSRKSEKRTKLGFGRFDTYKNAVLASDAKKHLPILASEIDCELQGDITNCGEIKARNRQDEALLLTTEKWATIAARFQGFTYPKEELYLAWEKLLFNQFHDIIGGSGIPEVCDDAHRDYDLVEEIGQRCLNQALGSITNRISTDRCLPGGKCVVVFNPLSWDRTELVQLPVEIASFDDIVSITSSNGKLVPFQSACNRVNDGSAVAPVVFETETPAMGYTTYFINSGTSPERVPVSTPTVVQFGNSIAMENEALKVEIDTLTGNVVRIWDKQYNRELLDYTRRGNCLVAIVDEGDSEGRFMKHHDQAPKPVGHSTDITNLLSITIIERGPIRAAVEVVKRYQASTFTQRIMLNRRGARLDFSVDMDWHDVHRMIKVAFPFNIPHPRITYHTQFGAIQRPSDGCEYPAQYWIDVSCQDFGISLLNDARYAHDVEGCQARFSLLRSPTEPARNTDEGHHAIRYAIVVHDSPLVPWTAMREGYAFNHPHVVAPASRHAGDMPLVKSFLRASPQQAIVEAIKQGFDSESTIVRCFNASNDAVEVCLEGPLAEGTEQAEVDMLERRTEEAPLTLDRRVTFKCAPAEIKTIELH